MALFGSASCAFALDREVFTFTNYALDVRLEPRQQRMGVRGRITLRNDSNAGQRIAVLQISSSLAWRAITADGKALQFVSQPFESDVDHTGTLTEAIVTLPRELKPKETVELEIGYEGTIPQDATRLTRIGTPEAKAKTSDWDRISENFSAVRGVGYVAWYPVAIESASLSEGNSVFQAVARWKGREASSVAKISIHTEGDTQTLICNGDGESRPGGNLAAQADGEDCTYATLGTTAPTFVMGNYSRVDGMTGGYYYLPGHKDAAEAYADAADQVSAQIADWLGDGAKISVVELPDADAAPFEAGTLFLAPFSNPDRKLARITLAHSLTHGALRSTRPWVNEGLAHFMQAMEVEQLEGRKAALDFMGVHRTALADVEEKVAQAQPAEKIVPPPLVSTFDETYYRSKAMYVWWMLRDMVGEPVLKAALRKYRNSDDTGPEYVQRLIQGESKKDVAWFFEDWVYQDKGLSDFRVESAFARKTEKGSYLLTVTVANAGGAGAEVPFTVRFDGGEIAQRIEVRGRSKATTRVEVPSAPVEVIVNDGSVPESDVSNNNFTLH